ncbi:Hypothetical_protein [Hexamita inflata]|uniref:Hypothetical_protein n=1 Tax=Hexamita inflata TaxID=28002 RepID=A0ABP1HWV8_9EUKA
MKLGTAKRMKLLQLIEYFIYSIDLPPTLFSFQISLNKVVLQFVLFSAFNALNFDQLLNDKFQTQCWQVSFDSNISALEILILELVLQLKYIKIWVNTKNHDQLVAQFTEIKLLLTQLPSMEWSSRLFSTIITSRAIDSEKQKIKQ